MRIIHLAIMGKLGVVDNIEYECGIKGVSLSLIDDEREVIVWPETAIYQDNTGGEFTLRKELVTCIDCILKA